MLAGHGVDNNLSRDKGGGSDAPSHFGGASELTRLRKQIGTQRDGEYLEERKLSAQSIDKGQSYSMDGVGGAKERLCLEVCLVVMDLQEGEWSTSKEMIAFRAWNREASSAAVHHFIRTLSSSCLPLGTSSPCQTWINKRQCVLSSYDSHTLCPSCQVQIGLESPSQALDVGISPKDAT